MFGPGVWRFLPPTIKTDPGRGSWVGASDSGREVVTTWLTRMIGKFRKRGRNNMVNKNDRRIVCTIGHIGKFASQPMQR